MALDDVLVLAVVEARVAAYSVPACPNDPSDLEPSEVEGSCSESMQPARYPVHPCERPSRKRRGGI